MRKSALCLSLALVASSCSGSSSDGDDAAQEAATTTTASPVNVERYCELVIVANARESTFEASDDMFDATKVEAYVGVEQLALSEAIEVADPEVRPSLELLEDELGEVVAALADVDYDFVAAIPALEATDSDEYDAAEVAVEAYDERVCGIEPEVEPEVDPGDGSDSAELTLEQAELIVESTKTPEGLASMAEDFSTDLPNLSNEQAKCFVSSLTADQWISFSLFGSREDADLGDPAFADMLSVLESCDIPISALL